MSTTEDWDAARRELLEEGRRRVGPPPTFEEVEALLRGELPEAEAERVRNVLAFYPELVQIMTADAPSIDEPVLTDAEREADLARIRQRLPVRPQRPERARRNVYALAAGVVIALAIAGALMVRSRQPALRATATKIMVPDADRAFRGPSAIPEIVLDASTDYVLKLLYRPRQTYREYRLELVDLNTDPPRALSQWRDVERQPDGSFPVQLATADLVPGHYQMVLYGVDQASERLAVYTFRIDR